MNKTVWRRPLIVALLIVVLSLLAGSTQAKQILARVSPANNTLANTGEGIAASQSIAGPLAPNAATPSSAN